VYAFAKLYTAKSALMAADLLNDRVVPFFEEQIESLPGYALHRITISTDDVLGIGEIFYATRIERLVVETD